MSFQRFSHHPVLGTEGETSLHMEICLINVNDFYEKEPSRFSELLLYLLLLKKNQLKIIFMPKRCILGWHTLLSSVPKTLTCLKSRGQEIDRAALWSQLAGSTRVWLQIPLPPGHHSGLVVVHSNLISRWVNSVSSAWMGLLSQRSSVLKLNKTKS